MVMIPSCLLMMVVGLLYFSLLEFFNLDLVQELAAGLVCQELVHNRVSEGGLHDFGGRRMTGKLLPLPEKRIMIPQMVDLLLRGTVSMPRGGHQTIGECRKSQGLVHCFLEILQRWNRKSNRSLAQALDLVLPSGAVLLGVG